MKIFISINTFSKFFIFFSILTTISSIKYKIFETTSEIAFSKIIKYNITLSDKKVENISKDLLSSSVLSVVVKISMGEDCKKKSSGCGQPLRIYGKINAEPIIENLSFDKKDDIGNYSDKDMIYGFDYSPCQFKLSDTIFLNLVGIEGKFNFTLSLYHDVQDNYKIVCVNGISPPVSVYPAVVNYDFNTFSYGGKFNNTFDDNIYYLGNDLIWKRIPRMNRLGPCGRYGHFMGFFDGKLIVFGGKDKNEVTLNDLWIYDIHKDIWTEIVYNNIVNNIPKPKFLVSSCIMPKHGFFLFFGGKFSEDNNIYLLNLNILNEILMLHYNNKYSVDDIETVAKLNKLWKIQTETNLISRYGHTITKISENEVMILGGFDSNDNAMSNCDIINVDTFVITNIYKENEERPSSRGFHNILPNGPILILYGGKLGNKENLNDVWKFVISKKKWIKLTEMDEFYLFRSGFVFTRLMGSEKPVIYGGENRNKETISDFILLNFPICQSETSILSNSICFPCPEGYIYSSQKKCEACGVGTYADYTDKYLESRCLECPVGTFNSRKGSFRQDNCGICPVNTYNDEIGRSSCRECKGDELCLPKTSSSIIKDKYYLDSYRKNSNLMDDNYPQFSSSKNEDISVWRIYGFYIICSICLFLVITLIISNYCNHKKTVIFLVRIDFIPITGGTTKKCSGGIITLFYTLIILGLCISYIIRYIYYNDLVEVIPISHSNNQGNIKASYNLGVELIGYDQKCIDEGKKLSKHLIKTANTTFGCSNEIQLKKSGTDLKIPFFCSIQKGICKVDINCENCRNLMNNDEIEILLTNNNSHVSFYKWNFITLWSETMNKTEGYSKLTGILKPDENKEMNYVFKGNQSTKITLLLTPVYFHDKVRNNHISGYRASQKGFQLGSVRNNYNYYSVNNGVKISFEFLYATNFYEINLKKQIELLDFLAYLMAILAGCSFISRMMKYFLEKLKIFNSIEETYAEFLEENEKNEDTKSRNEQNINGINNINSKVEMKANNNPDTSSHIHVNKDNSDNEAKK